MSLTDNELDVLLESLTTNTSNVREKEDEVLAKFIAPEEYLALIVYGDDTYLTPKQLECWYSFARSKGFLPNDSNKYFWVDDPEPFVAESNDLTQEKNVDCVIYEYRDWTISIEDIKSPVDIEHLTNLQKLTDFINGK